MVIDKNKIDKDLGKAVNKYLIKKKVETPISTKKIKLEDKEKIKIIENKFNEIMIALRLDLNNDSLKDTPNRVAKMFINDLFWGLKNENFPKCKTIENKINYDEMILVKDIKVGSDCEHHFRTIWGKAYIGYFPNKKILGLSKINRIVEYFCKRPQIQERLTEQIFFALEYILETSNIVILIEANHFCVKQRGIEDINSKTITSKFGGIFNEKKNLRNEFITLINK